MGDDYPGADYTMSLYGNRQRNPEETAGQWKELIKVGEMNTSLNMLLSSHFNMVLTLPPPGFSVFFPKM